MHDRSVYFITLVKKTLFGLFNKKDKPVPVTDLVWINDRAKKAGLLKLVKEKPGAVFIAWFEDTATMVENDLRSIGESIAINTSRHLHGSHTSGKDVIIVEHYPLFKKEQELFKNLNAASITVLSSLDEPLLQQFGGERISTIMKAMGMAEEEAVSHSMISSSLQKAQQKLEKEVTVEMPASSAAEWFRKNRPVSKG